MKKFSIWKSLSLFSILFLGLSSSSENDDDVSVPQASQKNIV